MIYKKGTTRFVLLIGKYCFKFPRFNSWDKFLKGCLANRSENFLYKYKFKDRPQVLLCPTYFSLNCGLLNIMARTNDIPDSLLKKLKECPGATRNLLLNSHGKITRDIKLENFGYYKGLFVLHDYDDTNYNCSACELNFKKESI